MNALAPQRLTVALRTARGQATEFEVRSTRRFPVQSWTADATATEAVRRIGMAFALCRGAQRAACQAAIEAASAVTMSPASALERAWAVAGELLREHAGNLLLAWPRIVGEEEQPVPVRALLASGGNPALLQDRLRGILAEDVLGTDPAAWLLQDGDRLQAWCTQAATATAGRFARWRGATASAPAVCRLPPVARWNRNTAEAMAAALRADSDFGQRPTWRGEPAETGAIARVGLHPLLKAWFEISGDDAAARMLARLIELAQAACAPLPAPEAIVRAWATGPGCSLAAVETSRGLLLHAVHLVQGRIADYRIVAPTEWNFHPQGMLRAVLGAAPGADACRAQAQAWTLALDPCVECDVELADA